MWRNAWAKGLPGEGATRCSPADVVVTAPRLRYGRRMKVKGVWTCGVLLGELGVGVGDDELKRGVWDCGPAALLAALTA